MKLLPLCCSSPPVIDDDDRSDDENLVRSVGEIECFFRPLGHDGFDDCSVLSQSSADDDDDSRAVAGESNATASIAIISPNSTLEI